MIRYGLLDYFFLQVDDEYQRESFKECDKECEHFPDGILTQLAARRDLILNDFKGEEGEELLVLPEALGSRISDKADGIPHAADLLLWAQRQYLDQCFPSYDPTLFFNVEALPWDKDHIWPQAKMDLRSGKQLVADRNKFNDYRWRYLHSYGNLRLWDRRDNRGAGDKTPLEKITRQDAEKFAIGNEILENFYKLSRYEGVISDEFLEDFKAVINARRVSIYREIYQALHFGELKKDIRASSDRD
jgi:hypothetical protein